MLKFNYFYSKTSIKSICLILLLIGGPVSAQDPLGDKIYLVNESSMENIDIIDLDKKKIKVRNQEGKELSFKARELLLAFNANGNYLTFPNSPEQIQDFQAQTEEEPNVGADLIITSYGQLVPVRISQENGSEIVYHDLTSGESDRKVSTNLIAAIIYKEGNHQLFASPGKVSTILGQLDEQVAAARQKHYNIPENEKPEPLSASNAGSREVAEKYESDPAVAASETGAARNLPELDHEAYSRKALEKTSELGTYLSIISDRNNNLEEANKAVELAVQLFIDENAQFEVSSKQGKSRYQVRAYLNRLKLLKYDRIEISWTDISYVSDLKKGMDGNFYGVITLQQRFKGYMDNRLVYGDLTEKNIEVKVMAYQKESDGEQQQMWDIFLSDVGVVVTKFDE